MRLAWLMLVVTACGDSTAVLVTVQGRPTLSRVEKLRVDVENGIDSTGVTFDLDGADLPRTFTITPEGRSGLLAVTVTALEDEGLPPRGVGTASIEIAPGTVANLTVMVDPTDFVMNQMTISGQTLSVALGHSGRQLALGADGALIALWENFCPLSRCDILARRFDEEAQPTENGTSLNSDDFLVNQTAEFTTTPSIAAGASGYLAAWRGLDDIRAAPLGLEGEHLLGTDLTVTSSTTTEQEPAVVARRDGYVIAWSDLRPAMTEHEVLAHLYDALGQPVGAEFRISQTATGDQELAHGAGLSGGRFLLTWLHREGGNVNVRGRLFAATGGAVIPSDLLLTDANGVYLAGATVTATPGGFALAWLEGTPAALFLSLFTEDGTPVIRRIAVSQSPADPGTAAVVSARPDGALGVAWHGCDVLDECDVRFRLVHPDGLPSGPELTVNTTLEGRQEGPSLAPFGDDAFFVAWTDSSQVAPDTDGDAVRGRVLYPSLERHDGTLGAYCEGEADCGSGLACIGGADRSRCTPECVGGEEGLPCPEGGVCRGGVCEF